MGGRTRNDAKFLQESCYSLWPVAFYSDRARVEQCRVAQASVAAEKTLHFCSTGSRTGDFLQFARFASWFRGRAFCLSRCSAPRSGPRFALRPGLASTSPSEPSSRPPLPNKTPNPLAAARAISSAKIPPPTSSNQNASQSTSASPDSSQIPDAPARSHSNSSATAAGSSRIQQCAESLPTLAAPQSIPSSDSPCPLPT